MKKIVFALFACMFGEFTLAQQKEAHISFTIDTHYFGTINESDGEVTYNFEFKNTGSLPLVITEVKASCGCTSSIWTKEPVAPGGKGFVAATYNPAGRPGSFNKSITISSNAENSPSVVHFTGEVIPKVKTLEDYYPKEMDKLRVESNNFSFTKVYKGEIKTERLKVVNVSGYPVKIEFSNVPAYITLKADPEVLAPKQEGLIVGSYDSNKKDDWGFVFDRVNIVYNGKPDKSNYITVTATIEENFSKLTPQELANAPRIEFKNSSFDFGSIKQNAKIEHEYIFTNTGKSELIIRKIKTSCGCTTVTSTKEIVPPGKSSSIKTIFDAGKRQGRQNKSITVITNDPKNPSFVLKLSGSVEANQ